jgi:DNA-binding FadR family transcriptional regulator
MHGLSRTRTRHKLRQPGMHWDQWFGTMTASHQEMVDVLRVGDPDEAARAVRLHLYSLKDASARDRESLMTTAREETAAVPHPSDGAPATR